MIIIAALVATAAAHAHPTPHATRTRSAPRAETLHVSSIDLAGEEGTRLKLKDAKGATLEVDIPVATCRKDHLGRLLPGMDVAVPVETRRGADGRPERFVRPERFAAHCD